MSKKLLLSAPLGCPGAASALRNHQAILKSSIDCDFIPLEYLIFPISKKHTQMRRIYYSVSRRLKIVSINKILSYGENIIFGSFSPTYEIIVRQLNKHGIRPSFIWHSSLGQLEQTPGERELFIRIITLLERGKIKYLLLHRRLYDSLGYFIKGATYLPHSIELTPYRSIVKKDLSGVNVDLFCRLRYGKNVLNQILAVKMAELDGSLHINFDTEQFHGIIETISSQIVRHGWLPIEEYYGLISAMDISLQVTIGESFIIKGFRVVEGKKGLFVGMPQERSKAGQKIALEIIPKTHRWHLLASRTPVPLLACAQHIVKMGKLQFYRPFWTSSRRRR